ncbi:MAG: helix-turn-helix transcriptional regulator [Rhizobiaceae bacterium]|nr:helix-turn-helix transcriptional regulator [Rhizobiaceae bacterium]
MTEGVFLLPHAVPAHLRWAVRTIIGFRETTGTPSRMVEPATLDVPFVLNFGSPFAIGLGAAPCVNECFDSFAAGLFAGAVVIDSNGTTECVQVNFTPLGARRFFGVPAEDMTGRMIALHDILGTAGTTLRERLGELRAWDARFDLLERFIERRLQLGDRLPAEVACAYDAIVASGGRAPILDIARDIGWSRKHLAQRFRQDVGLTPKTVARIVRFRRALACRAHLSGSWADAAYCAGYADQSHLNREFRALGGLPAR